MQKSKQIIELWITNISNNRISLGDLRITIAPGQMINLLKPKNAITLEMATKSYQTGSISKKLDKLRLGKVKSGELPKIELSTQPTVAQKCYGYIVDQKQFGDIYITDEEMLDDTKMIDDFIEEELKNNK